MKALFTRPPSSPPPSPSKPNPTKKHTHHSSSSSNNNNNDASAFASSSMTSWPIPPFPHPLPERKIGILPTKDGLLILPRTTTASPSPHRHAPSSSTATASVDTAPPSRPSFSVARCGSLGLRMAGTAPASPSSSSLDTALRIRWGRNGTVELLSHHQWTSLLTDLNRQAQADGTSAAAASVPLPVEEMTAYGLVGVERMFSRAYLFAITGRKQVGAFLHRSRPVYCCSAVVAIPLEEASAREVVAVQCAKQRAAAKRGGGDASGSEAESEQSSEGESEEGEQGGVDDVETPAAISREPFFSEGGGAATVRAPKARPWLARTGTRSVSESRNEAQGAAGEGDEARGEAAAGTRETEDVDVPVAVEELHPDQGGPERVEDPEREDEEEPLTPEQQYHQATRAELEEKVVKETRKHFARGEFWFAYDFDLTTSMQRKHDAIHGRGGGGGGGPGPDGGIAPRRSSLPSAAGLAPPSAPLPASERSDETDGMAVSHEPLPFDEPFPTLPLWRRADRRFWHNEHLCRDLIRANAHAFILPIMQGYLQIVDLPVQPRPTRAEDDGHADGVAETDDDAGAEPHHATASTLLVVSRRSKERAGLRYQRRGINDAGHVANFVETEQVLFLRFASGSQRATDQPGAREGEAGGSGRSHLFAFLQIRGSIPLFWSQSPFALKPPPVLERHAGENLQACQRHFDALVRRYGTVVCVNLAEQAGKEGAISKRYRETVRNVARFVEWGTDDDDDDDDGGPSQEARVRYTDFDFHKECAGMRFENVQKLIAAMARPLRDEVGYFCRSYRWTSPTAGRMRVESRQRGTVRTSCLDCLDRTNVVQSAFAREVLARWLGGVGVGVVA